MKKEILEKLDAIEQIAKVIDKEQKKLIDDKVFDLRVHKAFENIKDEMRGMTLELGNYNRQPK